MSEPTKDGALFELLSRGNKDLYFQNDTMTALSPFRNNYKRVPAYIHELRKIPPTNNTDFGKIIEFDFEVAGDVFTEPTLLIDLPSWLPEQHAILNSKSIVTDLGGNSYGYTKGVGYFLFENIQVYQDQILLQEFSGDALFATRLSRDSLNSAFLENELLGYHDGTNISIGRNATLPTLRLVLPLLGCQHIDDGGFPSFGVRQQSFRLRCKLRKLEDLVESSDGKEKPTPWNSMFKIQTSSGEPTTNFQTLDRFKIEQPSIYLESRHIYVDPDTQKALVETDLETPFLRLYENIFNYIEKDYAPLAGNALATTTRRIDAVHPASRMIFFMRQRSDIRKNKLWKISSDTLNNEYYNSISFLIGSRDRETSFPPFVWNLIAQHAKEDRYSGSGLGVMNWDLGDQKGRTLPSSRQPEGSVNFSTADRPVLYAELQQIAGTNRDTEIRLIVECWAVYEISDRRGALKYAN